MTQRKPDARDALIDAERETWPDKEFVVLARTPRKRALEQIARLRQALNKNEDPSAIVRRLVATLNRIRDLIRARVPAAAARSAR
jgi:hypothetical protein